MNERQMFEKSFSRPRNFFSLSPPKQWEIDKELGILDWKGEDLTDEDKERFFNYYTTEIEEESEPMPDNHLILDYMKTTDTIFYNQYSEAFKKIIDCEECSVYMNTMIILWDVLPEFSRGFHSGNLYFSHLQHDPSAFSLVRSGHVN